MKPMIYACQMKPGLSDAICPTCQTAPIKKGVYEVLVAQAVTLMSHGCQDKRPNRAALIVWKVRLAMLPVVA